MCSVTLLPKANPIKLLSFNANNLFQSFEDLEFSLLEEEAWWLSRREELQREVSEAMTRCAERREKLASLQTQREQAIKHATSTNKLLEQQHAELMDSINKVCKVKITEKC